MATPDGVVKARTIKRRMPPERWTGDLSLNNRGIGAVQEAEEWEWPGQTSDHIDCLDQNRDLVSGDATTTSTSITVTPKDEEPTLVLPWTYADARDGGTFERIDPYWDPRLRRCAATRRRFLLRLVELGLDVQAAHQR